MNTHKILEQITIPFFEVPMSLEELRSPLTAELQIAKNFDFKYKFNYDV